VPEPLRIALARLRELPDQARRGVHETKRVLRELPRETKRAVVEALDNKEVRRFVWLWYFPLFLWGIYGTFLASPNATVEPIMGHMVYNLWVWLCLLATSWVMVALTLRSETGEYIGLWMQAGGHFAMFWVVLTFWVCAIVGTPWGAGSFGIFALSALPVGCLWLSAQAGREIWLKLHPELRPVVEPAVIYIPVDRESPWMQ